MDGMTKKLLDGLRKKREGAMLGGGQKRIDAQHGAEIGRASCRERV